MLFKLYNLIHEGTPEAPAVIFATGIVRIFAQLWQPKVSTTFVTGLAPGKCRYIRMKKPITILAILLVVAATATAEYVYKKHLRLEHAPLLKATLSLPHLEERSVNIHDAPVPVQTEKDQESQAKPEPAVAAGPQPHTIDTQETFAWTPSNNGTMEDILQQRQAKPSTRKQTASL